MSHAVGGPPDSRLSIWEVYNQAGRSLFNMRGWNWRSMRPQEFPSVAGKDYIELGDDFGNPLYISIKNSVLLVRQVDMQQIMRMRQNGLSIMGGGSYVTFEGNSPRTRQAGGGKSLTQWPVPTVNGQPTYLISYQSMWREARSDKINEFPNIPDWMDAALDFHCRAFIRNLVGQENTIEEQMYKEELLVCIREDGTRQIDYGPLQGGADSFYSDGRYVQGYSSVGFGGNTQ